MLKYQYMKNNDISLLNYHSITFFNIVFRKPNPSDKPPLSNHKIEGLTVVDKLEPVSPMR